MNGETDLKQPDDRPVVDSVYSSGTAPMELNSLEHYKAIIRAAEREIASLREQLGAYAGWSPHQFTNLLKEYRELQQKFISENSAKFRLQEQLEKAQGEVERLRGES